MVKLVHHCVLHPWLNHAIIKPSKENTTGRQAGKENAMTRRERRGFTQNRMRFIWKQVKSFFELASDYDEFTELCLGFYYDNASSTVDMDEYRKIVSAVNKSR